MPGEATVTSGPQGVHFHTRLKTVTARWPDGIKSGAVFTFPSTH